MTSKFFKPKKSSFTPVRSKYLVLTTEYVIPLIIIAVAISSWFIATQTPVLSIRSISCIRDEAPCQDVSILSELDTYMGTNLLNLPEDQIRTTIIEGSRTVKTVEIIRRIPNSVQIILESTDPVVALKVESQFSKWVILDDNLRVIRVQSDDPSLPTVLANQTQEVQIGQRIDSERVQRALELALEISQQFFTVQSISLEGDTVVLLLPDNRKALITTRKQTYDQLIILQAILADDTILQSTNYNTIDVRFDQPVLKSE